MARLKPSHITRDLTSSLHILPQVNPRTRRRQARLALTLGVVATAASLGILAGQVLRAAAGL